MWKQLHFSHEQTHSSTINLSPHYIYSASSSFQQHTGQSISSVHHWNVSYRHLWPINQDHQQPPLAGRHLHFSAVQASFRLGLAERWPSALPAEMSEIDGAVIYKAPVSSVVSSFAPQLLHDQIFFLDGLHRFASFIVREIGFKRDSLTDLIF